MPVIVMLVVASAAGGVTYLVARHGARPLADRLNRPFSRDARALTLLPGLALTAVVTVTVGALAILVERSTALRRWDDTVERWVVDQAGSGTTDALRAVTYLGDTVTVVAVTAVVATAAVVVWRRPRLAVFLGVVVVAQWVLANAIKWLVGRPRPELDPLSTFSGHSFPSGHSTAAAATALALALVIGAVVPARRPLLVAAGVTVGVAVGASRALLGVHWFTDVVAGLVLGWWVCLLTAWALRISSAREVSATAAWERTHLEHR